MTDVEIADLMEAQYQSIFQNREALATACQSFAQQNQFLKYLNMANLNALQARQRIFAVNDPQVKLLFDELTTAQADIEASLANLHNIADVLNSISSGVQVALQLLSPALAVAATI